MDRKEHWNRIYTTKASDALSWFEDAPTTSLRLLDSAGISSDTCLIDVGGGESRLIDHLLERGLHCLYVLDLSTVALTHARARLGERANAVTWIEADVTGEWKEPVVDIWHDRAVFHFLTEPDDRVKYVAHLKASVRAGGTAMLATFALDGPETCSGLPVQRYSAQTLAAELGPAFRLEEASAVRHRTPAGRDQSFVFCRFRYVARSTARLVPEAQAD